jgi:hypothetical protein
MPTDTSEAGLETIIVAAMTGVAGAAEGGQLAEAHSIPAGNPTGSRRDSRSQ